MMRANDSYKKYVAVVEVHVEHGVNDSAGTQKNVQDWLNKVLASNMGHQREKGIMLKVKGVKAHKPSRIA